MDILGFGITWAFAGMVVVGATVHSFSWGGVYAIFLPQLQLAQVSDFLFLVRIVNCTVCNPAIFSLAFCFMNLYMKMRVVVMHPQVLFFILTSM